jgi:signal recognition particle subunit SRP54
MFSSLSDRLNSTLKKLRGQGRLSEKNIQKALKDVRNALLEADVALPVVKDFIAKVRRASLGSEVAKSLTPGQAFIKIVQRELTQIMGEKNASLNLGAQPPVVILMAGLQGSGKTTSTAKLARLLKTRDKKKVMVVSTDVYRPAAIKQLQTLAQELEVDWFPSDESQKPVKIAKDALEAAKKQLMDVLIVDTAGRLHIDEAMMAEVKQIHASVDPVETLFVVDSMTGQDAVNTARVFHDTLPLTGVILTKTDGDARGGAALSIRQVTGKPIKFMGTGEKTDALEAFHPDRVASRILGMGDVLSLIEEIEQSIDKEKSEQFAKKVKKGKGFDLQDFREQLTQMGKMGGLTGIMSKLPGMGDVPDQVKNQLNDKMTVRMAAMIDSMTVKERRNPDIIKGSRKRRIASGSGVEVQDVNKLLKQFTQMQKMMKKVGKGGMGKMMRQMQGMMPPGGGGSIGT